MASVGWARSVIRITGITKTFGVKRVLDNIDFHFVPGQRYGLVGANGAGKSTLLNIITGLEEPDGGEVVRPKQCRVSYLPQYPNPQPRTTVLDECMSGDQHRDELRRGMLSAGDAMAHCYSIQAQEKFETLQALARHEDAHLLDAEAHGLLSGLGFSALDIGRSPLEFSGGWRMRLELAKILLSRPDFLVLDEPTNHLDLPTILWFESKMIQFAGCLLYVSHDRALLNRLSTQTLHLRAGRMACYPGGFDRFLELSAQQDEQRARQIQRVSSEAQRLEDFAKRFGAKATMASRAKSKLRMAERLRELETEWSEGQPAGDRSIAIRIPEAPPSGRTVLRCAGLCFGHDSPLTESFDLTIERGMKVAIIGPNGAGKSTLLRTLIGERPPLAGSIEQGRDVVLSYFAQEQAEVLVPTWTPLKAVLDATPQADPRTARSLLGALCFAGDDVDKPVSVLSGGEKNRVGLARLLSGSANLLVLDEPTNHLDMPSVEVLSQALGQFSGTALFVSHNRDFIESVCTHVLAVTRCGRAGFFIGGLDDYQRSCQRMGFPDVLGSDVSSSTVGTPGKDQSAPLVQPSPARRGEAALLRKELTRVESRLAALELEKRDVEAKLAACSHGEYQRAQALGADLTRVTSEQSVCEEKWLELQERLETMDR